MLLSVTPLVEAGFVVAVADARGTGFSEGVYDYYNLEGGPFDGFDLVEWLAEQPWCTGRVGMMGSSAAAISCYITAFTHPPHLEAMAANMHPGDFYFDQWRPAGCSATRTGSPGGSGCTLEHLRSTPAILLAQLGAKASRL